MCMYTLYTCGNVNIYVCKGSPQGNRWGHLKILYKAPEDYTKPQNFIERPERLYKAQADYTKPRQTVQSPKEKIQRPTHIRQRQKY